MPKILLAMVLFVTAGEFSRHRVSELFRHTDVLAAMCEAEVLQRDLLSQQIAQQGRGISPASAWHCPASHPIKGNFTTYNGERCIFHSPGGQFYDKTKPEMRTQHRQMLAPTVVERPSDSWMLIIGDGATALRSWT